MSSRWFALFLLMLILVCSRMPAQPAEPIAHARAVLSLLQQNKVAEIESEFNAQMAAAVPAATLSQVWPSLQMQAGAFKSEIDQQRANVRGGTAVTIGLQFERTALNMIVVFESDNKIGGLQFVPRPAAAVAATLPAGSSRVPGIVLVHGSGPGDRDETIGPNKPFRDLAWGLAASGIAVLRYEKRTRLYGEKLASNLNLTVQEETIDDGLCPN
jgi:uncharacterized protein